LDVRCIVTYVLHRSGYEVITTCSPRNFDLVKSLGASAAFDYNSPTCGADIRKHTNNALFYCWDTISEEGSAQICADALSSNTAPDGSKPKYGCILDVKFPRDDVEKTFTLGYTVTGESFNWPGKVFEASRNDFEFGKKFWEVARKLLEEGKYKAHPLDVRPGGLNGVIDGMEDMRQGKVSGKKLVYRVTETQG